ncbi:hypothetical protein CEUSTIGMA_g9949.t1 [Chlamydomonas eustigma]|uniref:Uncharacterized protein n=1 Tax=Chlamydomonas eustigma TaxID=1157962 RepID=A0A250XHY1_9CHLO|nr:hypothetical protein CEUSTIGMA_g9949.t1 [Chlamydomonas eustigma]|eukprot:GAX82522.1 hypothetical protein CEUSTIGMA_g9949.t1 [Chlamydomonas eustigma]
MISTDYKVALLGDSSVGKSSLVFCYQGKTSSASYYLFQDLRANSWGKPQQSSGYTSQPAFASIAGEEVWDIGGETSKNTSLLSMYLKGCQAVLLLFDPTKPQTFSNTLSWLDAVKQCFHRDIEGNRRGGMLESTNSLLLPYTAIVRCKCDLDTENLVSVHDQEHLAKQLGLYSYYTSSLTGQGVQSTLRCLAADLLGVPISPEDLKDATNPFMTRRADSSEPCNDSIGMIIVASNIHCGSSLTPVTHTHRTENLCAPQERGQRPVRNVSPYNKRSFFSWKGANDRQPSRYLSTSRDSTCSQISSVITAGLPVKHPRIREAVPNVETELSLIPQPYLDNRPAVLSLQHCQGHEEKIIATVEEVISQRQSQKLSSSTAVCISITAPIKSECEEKEVRLCALPGQNLQCEHTGEKAFQPQEKGTAVRKVSTLNLSWFGCLSGAQHHHARSPIKLT